MLVKKKNNISRPHTTSICMPPEGESLETIESIRNAKRKAAELVDATLSLINSKILDTAGSYYLKAKLGDEIGTFVENADDVQQKARDSRIQAALDHLGIEHDVSCVVKNGTHFVIRNDIPGNELKRDVVSLKTKLAFL